MYYFCHFCALSKYSNLYLFFFSIMDFETGENFADKETGEVPDKGLLDSETGELELVRKQPEFTAAKRPFKIPPAYMKQTSDTESDRTATIPTTNSNTFSNALLFLLPSVFFFMPITALILGILEMSLHAWAHRRNNLLRSNNINNIYYRSPMHGLASQFCGICKFEATKERIGKLQDKWNKRFIKYGIECVKQVV